MLKLPLCPYCSARFLYPDVKAIKGNKTGICPHCNSKFKINSKYKYILFLCAFFLLVGMNWLLLSVPSMNFCYLMAVTAIGVVAVYFLIPFTVRFQQTDQAEPEKAQSRKKKKKKNEA